MASVFAASGLVTLVDTEAELWDRLLVGGTATLLAVSNRPATMARADQVLVMDRGVLLPGAG